MQQRKNKVIYTSIVGDFDNLIQPPVTDEDFDYICFVKKGLITSDRIGVWSIREIPFNSNDNRALSRYPKLQPHKVLADYDYSLWIDGNVSIKDDNIYKIIKNKIADSIVYSGLNHWGRDCVYDEAVGIANSVKEPFLHLAKTVRFLKKQHFPKHYGLYENNVILRKHNDPMIINFDDLWWNLFCQYAQRDQLFHTYCYRIYNLKFDYLLPKRYCARNHPYFIYVQHRVIPKRKFGLHKLMYDIKRKIHVIILKLLSLM